MTMSDDVEELLALAFKAEKFGDRNKALSLYRQVASGGSEHASYAQNCAETLEQLGVPAEAKPPELVSPSPGAPGSGSGNPFESPSFAQPRQGATETGFDTIRRIQITTMIVRSVSVFCVLASLYCFLWIWTDYGHLYNTDNWSRVRISALLDFSLAITLVVVVWMGARYATALQRLLPVSEKSFDTYSKRQLSLWVGVGLLAALRLARELVYFLYV
ncbi:MAG: hypothetical protein ACI87E_000003 [Mariniblastus sp.]|jgi:hypothetical protein